MPTSLELGIWAVSVILAAIAGYGSGWGMGFRRGARWKQPPWDGTERRQRLPLDPPSRHGPPD